MRDNLKILDDVYTTFKDKFECSFHNLLWQLLINENFKGIEAVLVPNYDNCGLSLVIAQATGGYTPTGCYFNNGITYDEGMDIAKKITKEVFGEVNFDKIMCSSMFSK